MPTLSGTGPKLKPTGGVSFHVLIFSTEYLVNKLYFKKTSVSQFKKGIGSPRPYIRKAGVGGRFSPTLLQVVGPVKVLAPVAAGPLQGHAVLQAPLDGQDAG